MAKHEPCIGETSNWYTPPEIFRALARLSHTIFAGLRGGLFAFLQTRCPVASRDARVAGTFPGCGGSEDVVSGEPGGEAAWVARCGDACQTGEARAFAAATRRLAAQPQA